MRTIEQHTDHLLMRQWRAGDFEFYAEFFGDESTARYYGGAMNQDQAWRHLASVIGHWELRGFGVWAVEEKETNTLIGCAGMWQPHGWPASELAFWFTPRVYDTENPLEAVRAARKFALEQIRLSNLVSYIHPDNKPARIVVEAVGGQLVNTIELFDFGPHCAYEHASDSTE